MSCEPYTTFARVTPCCVRVPIVSCCKPRPSTVMLAHVQLCLTTTDCRPLHCQLVPCSNCRCCAWALCTVHAGEPSHMLLNGAALENLEVLENAEGG